MRSLVLILECPFALPPLITESIDETLSPNSEVVHLFELEQVAHISAETVERPLLVVLGGLENSIDLQHDVVEIVHLNASGSYDFVCGQYDSLCVLTKLSRIVIRLLEARLDGFGVVPSFLQ